MVMQINRTPTPNNPPASGALAQGQLSVGMADTPNPTLWVGVPTTIDPTGRRLVNGPGALFSTTAAGTVPMTGAATAAAVLTAAGTWTVPPVYTTTVNGVVPAPTAAAPAAAMLTAAGAWALPQIKITTQIFTASGTYTPPAGLQWAIVECRGGGGGGGGVYQGAANGFGGGGGGGQGGYSRSILSAAQVGVSQTVTIGAGGIGGAGSGIPAAAAGGTTSFGSLVIANGGAPGARLDMVALYGDAGNGGVAGTGQFTQPGLAGTPPRASSFNGTVWVLTGGNGGGADILVSQTVPGVGTNGTANLANGAGGNGAVINAWGAGFELTGGSGVDGICIVTEYSF